MAENVLHFARVLRASGIPIGTDKVMDAVRALPAAGLERRGDWHATLAALPPRPAGAPAFLPVDRVFALPGHGTIVTGTLMQGTLHAGDTLRLDPPGRDVRVRALHVFGSARAAVGVTASPLTVSPHGVLPQCGACWGAG